MLDADGEGEEEVDDADDGEENVEPWEWSTEGDEGDGCSTG